MRLFARYTDTRLYVRIFLRILIPFPIHLRVLYCPWSSHLRTTGYQLGYVIAYHHATIDADDVTSRARPRTL